MQGNSLGTTLKNDRMGGLKVVEGCFLQKGWMQNEKKILHCLWQQLKSGTDEIPVPSCKGDRDSGCAGL